MSRSGKIGGTVQDAFVRNMQKSNVGVFAFLFVCLFVGLFVCLFVCLLFNLLIFLNFDVFTIPI